VSNWTDSAPASPVEVTHEPREAESSHALRPTLALAAWISAIAGVLVLDDPRLRYPAFLALAGLAAASWLVLMHEARRSGWSKGFFRGMIAAAIAARIAGIASAPAFSEDVFRHVYEGRVVWAHGLAFPFVHPPREAPLFGVSDEILDESWRRINHAEIPTLYPVLAQGVFATAAAIGGAIGDRHLVAIKSALVIADLAVFAILALALAAVGRRKEESVAWGLCPIVVLEVSREGHADSLAALGLAIAIFGFVALRPRRGYLGLGLAALAKLNGLAILPAALRADRRGVAAAIVILPLLALPLFLGGAAASRGLETYAESWRAGDGAFSIVLSLAEWILGGDWKDLGGFTLTRHQLARGLAALLFFGGAVALLRKPYETREIPERAAGLVLLLLLLSPTVHPWYAMWLVPFVPFAGRWRLPIVALVALAPLAHHPAWLELVSGEWRDLAWVRALMHVPVWTIAAWVAVKKAEV
jgi:hypothetical protein